jgi:hypothetical protein
VKPLWHAHDGAWLSDSAFHRAKLAQGDEGINPGQ